ncbi:MAG: flagellar assembly peptidoglycan hydrolase FlgJ [Pseudomonadota bacterium]|jgi:flagellar protein FlgJ
MLTAPNADVYTDFNGLAKLKNQARKDSPEALKEVAKQFESIFLNNVLKSMRAAKLADGAMDNDQSKFYNDMYDQQLAVHLSGSPGVGLADLIAKQLSRHKAENTKPDVEDYLNKLASVARGAEPVRQVSTGFADGQVMVTPYVHDRRPLAPMTTVKESDRQPIQSVEEFIRRLYPLAVQAGHELGVEPKVILAQAALESGWGRSTIKNSNGDNSFNLFNIKADKAWQGKQAQVATLEFDQGIPKKINAGFRSYNSFQESFKDYVAFIKNNPRYGDALKKAGNAEQYMAELQRAGYATDPKYADKVMSIYQGNTIAGFEPELIVAMNQ